MHFRKIAIALGVSLSFGLSACDDSSSPTSITGEENINNETQSSSSAKEAKDVDKDKDDVKSSSSKKNSSSSAKSSSSSKAKSSSSAKETKDVDEKDQDGQNLSSESAESSESNPQEDIASSSSSESSDTGSEGDDAESSSSVEIDPEAFNDADLEQCSGKSNGTKVNIGGIPFICMNGQISVDEDGINELIGNKYKGCEDSKLEDDIWIFSSSPMGSWNTEKFKWITETSYEYTTFPVPPDQMEAYEELADLGLGPDKQTIEGANREEVYAKYCGK